MQHLLESRMFVGFTETQSLTPKLGTVAGNRKEPGRYGGTLVLMDRQVNVEQKMKQGRNRRGTDIYLKHVNTLVVLKITHSLNSVLFHTLGQDALISVA